MKTILVLHVYTWVSPGFWKGVAFLKIPDFHGQFQRFAYDAHVFQAADFEITVLSNSPRLQR
jgi:hypothetical protein